eukprot:3452940-Prymnesium_polylepis.1
MRQLFGESMAVKSLTNVALIMKSCVRSIAPWVSACGSKITGGSFLGSVDAATVASWVVLRAAAPA